MALYKSCTYLLTTRPITALTAATLKIYNKNTYSVKLSITLIQYNKYRKNTRNKSIIMIFLRVTNPFIIIHLVLCDFVPQQVSWLTLKLLLSPAYHSNSVQLLSPIRSSSSCFCSFSSSASHMILQNH